MGLGPTELLERRHVADHLARLGHDVAVTVVRAPDVPEEIKRTFGFLDVRDPPSLAGYRLWVEAGQYSALLYDGALLQVSYDFAGAVLVAHRLAWIPCPFLVDTELLQREPLLDVLDLYAAGDPGDVVLRTAIRFDFDIERAAPDHPAAHMTINASHCRIACAAPLRLGHFVDFILRNFYPELWQIHPYLATISRKEWGSRTVTEAETQGLHVSWRR